MKSLTWLFQWQVMVVDFKMLDILFPKPLIEINNKPMIQIVLETLNIDANFIFIIQKEHQTKYNISSLLRTLKPNCTIIELNKVTKGAACTVLLAKKYIKNDHPLTHF